MARCADAVAPASPVTTTKAVHESDLRRLQPRVLWGFHLIPTPGFSPITGESGGVSSEKSLRGRLPRNPVHSTASIRFTGPAGDAGSPHPPPGGSSPCGPLPPAGSHANGGADDAASTWPPLPSHQIG